VAAANPKTFVVLETGAPVLTPWRDRVAALAEAWYPGQEGGTAIARVLFGDVDPGGRLPATFPANPSQLQTAGDPFRYPGVADEERYSEGVFVGYRWYDAGAFRPAFPFGFGLSYTTFRLGDLRVAAGTAGSQSVATVSVDVTNTGSRTGIAVPQLYLAPPQRLGPHQPLRELKGFASLTLAPGQTARVTFPLNDRSFAYFDARSNDWRIAPGCYGVEVGISERSLPLHGEIARGEGCPGAAVALGLQGAFFLPLPDPVIVR
jgi:beta-glucosidase